MADLVAAGLGVAGAISLTQKSKDNKQAKKGSVKIPKEAGPLVALGLLPTPIAAASLAAAVVYLGLRLTRKSGSPEARNLQMESLEEPSKVSNGLPSTPAGQRDRYETAPSSPSQEFHDAPDGPQPSDIPKDLVLAVSTKTSTPASRPLSWLWELSSKKPSNSQSSDGSFECEVGSTQAPEVAISDISESRMSSKDAAEDGTSEVTEVNSSQQEEAGEVVLNGKAEVGENSPHGVASSVDLLLLRARSASEKMNQLAASASPQPRAA